MNVEWILPVIVMISVLWIIALAAFTIEFVRVLIDVIRHWRKPDD